ncbi:hypothetical protein B0H63DRAFT_448182 [Podospora didyma]|uniref:Ecp2 effector protein domain-containing protein n=1 Tax=Podospora didyma TaxID=330526 RepID=A0AAE0NT98_9PEZI|nr:hypothetical protein B0H63DRAFT_448182 [Podospora didyma]
MRTTTTLVFIAGLASTAFGAATKMFDDDNCSNEIDKVVFNGFANGDAPIPANVKTIRTDSISDIWFAYQRNDGSGCKGDLLRRLDNNQCIKVSDLGIGCTRLCFTGIGAASCSPSTIP